MIGKFQICLARFWRVTGRITVDKPVNRVRAKSPAANVAVPVLAPARPSWLIAVENDDPFDRFTHAKIAQLAGGFSPMGVAEAAFDWALHLAASPGRQAALAVSALSKQAALVQTSASLSSEDSGGSAPKRAAADAGSPPRNGDTGRFRFTPKAFSRRSDGGTKPRRRYTARRATISRCSISSPDRRSTQSHRPTSSSPIRSRSNGP